MQTVAHSSEPRPEPNSPSGFLRSVWPKPSTASTLHPRVFYLSVLIPPHWRLFDQNHTHDQTWPGPIKVRPYNSSLKPSDTSAMPTAMWAETKKKPVLLFKALGWRRHLADGWETSDVITDLWGRSCLFLVWSEATGPGLHSQVPEQNRRNLSGLNKTQNHRLQICMKRGLDSS